MRRSLTRWSVVEGLHVQDHATEHVDSWPTHTRLLAMFAPKHTFITR